MASKMSKAKMAKAVVSRVARRVPPPGTTQDQTIGFESVYHRLNRLDLPASGLGGGSWEAAIQECKAICEWFLPDGLIAMEAHLAKQRGVKKAKNGHKGHSRGKG